MLNVPRTPPRGTCVVVCAQVQRSLPTHPPTSQPWAGLGSSYSCWAIASVYSLHTQNHAFKSRRRFIYPNSEGDFRPEAPVTHKILGSKMTLDQRPQPHAKSSVQRVGRRFIKSSVQVAWQMVGPKKAQKWSGRGPKAETAQKGEGSEMVRQKVRREPKKAQKWFGRRQKRPQNAHKWSGRPKKAQEWSGRSPKRLGHGPAGSSEMEPKKAQLKGSEMVQEKPQKGLRNGPAEAKKSSEMVREKS